MTQDIGSLIKSMRRASGMSQMRLADKIGVSYQQVQKYEKGGNRISVPRLIQIAEVFGVPVTSFMQIDIMDSDSLKKSEQSALTEGELVALGLFRRIKPKSAADHFLNIMRSMVKVVEGK